MYVQTRVGSYQHTDHILNRFYKVLQPRSIYEKAYIIVHFKKYLKLILKLFYQM